MNPIYENATFEIPLLNQQFAWAIYELWLRDEWMSFGPSDEDLTLPVIGP